MTHRSYSGLLLIGLILSAPSWGALGTWIKEPKQIPTDAPFVLLESGMFWKKGGLKPYLKDGELKEVCKNKTKVEAWLIHLLQKGTVFKPEAGTRLAGEIDKNFKDTCVSEVELNFEYTPSPPPPWLAPFLKALRTKLPKHYSLRLVTPPITNEPLQETHWTAEEAKPLLDVVDGFDIRVYNTGLRNYSAYGRVLTDAVTFAGSAPSKQFVLSFPSYYLRRPKHLLKIENMKIVAEGLKRLPPDKAKILCSDKIQLAYYARWMAHKEDVPGIEAASKWREQTCK